jgi:hypothetical protein
MMRCKIEGQSKIKDEHPITVAFVHNMWTNIDIVSEDDLPEDIDSVTTIPEECTTTLPKLTIGSVVQDSLNISQKRAFTYISDKVNVILNMQNNNKI